jgi:hypothetical protein
LDQGFAVHPCIFSFVVSELNRPAEVVRHQAPSHLQATRRKGDGLTMSPTESLPTSPNSSPWT